MKSIFFVFIVSSIVGVSSAWAQDPNGEALLKDGAGNLNVGASSGTKSSSTCVCDTFPGDLHSPDVRPSTRTTEKPVKPQENTGVDANGG